MPHWALIAGKNDSEAEVAAVLEAVRAQQACRHRSTRCVLNSRPQRGAAVPGQESAGHALLGPGREARGWRVR